MGNHEYCTECGENDFHSHRDCYTETKAKYQAEKKEADTRLAWAQAAAEQMVEKLVRQGIPAKLGMYGNVEISKWDLI